MTFETNINDALGVVIERVITELSDTKKEEGYSIQEILDALVWGGCNDSSSPGYCDKRLGEDCWVTAFGRQRKTLGPDVMCLCGCHEK